MTKKHIFKPTCIEGRQLPDIEYTPFIYIAGTETHRLALHKEPSGKPDPYREWQVSDPVSGRQVCRVYASYQGVPCSSKGFGLKQARDFANATLDALLNRIGSDKFNATIKAANKATA